MTREQLVSYRDQAVQLGARDGEERQLGAWDGEARWTEMSAKVLKERLGISDWALKEARVICKAYRRGYLHGVLRSMGENSAEVGRKGDRS